MPEGQARGFTRTADAGRPEEPAVKQLAPTAPIPTPHRETVPPQSDKPPEGILKRLWTNLFAHGPIFEDIGVRGPGVSAEQPQSTSRHRGDESSRRRNGPSEERRRPQSLPDRGKTRAAGQQPAPDIAEARAGEPAGDDPGESGTIEKPERQKMGETSSRRGSRGRGRRGGDGRRDDSRRQAGRRNKADQSGASDGAARQAANSKGDRAGVEDDRESWSREQAPPSADTTGPSRGVAAQSEADGASITSDASQVGGPSYERKAPAVASGDGAAPASVAEDKAAGVPEAGDDGSAGEDNGRPSAKGRSTRRRRGGGRGRRKAVPRGDENPDAPSEQPTTGTTTEESGHRQPPDSAVPAGGSAAKPVPDAVSQTATTVASDIPTAPRSEPAVDMGTARAEPPETGSRESPATPSKSQGEGASTAVPALEPAPAPVQNPGRTPETGRGTEASASVAEATLFSAEQDSSRGTKAKETDTSNSTS